VCSAVDMLAATLLLYLSSAGSLAPTRSLFSLTFDTGLLVMFASPCLRQDTILLDFTIEAL
jgi:hypothetical protein